MKSLLLWIALCASSYAFEHKTTLTFQTTKYQNFESEQSIYGDMSFQIKEGSFAIESSLHYLYSHQYSQKRYLRLNELTLSKSFEHSKIQVGKMVKFWGELEGYNISDIFNSKDYLFDPFDGSQKLGSFAVDYSYFWDNSSIELGMKLDESAIEYPNSNSPYGILPQPYIKEPQTQETIHTPSLYLKYNVTLESNSIQSENNLILWHGYDNKRYFIPINNQLAQYAYRVNKALFFSNIVYDDTIFKIELAYSDVIDDSRISDYMQIGLGVEKSIYDIKGVDINLYFQYYRYLYEEEEKIKYVDMGEVYDNDLFMALKLNFNNTQTSEFKMGLLYDIKNSEKVWKSEFKTRIVDGLIFKAQYLKINAKPNTLLNNYGNSKRAIFNLTYTF